MAEYRTDCLDLLLNKLVEATRESERERIAGELQRALAGREKLLVELVLSVVLNRDIET